MKYWQWAIKIPLQYTLFVLLCAHLLFGNVCHAQKFTFKYGYKQERLDFQLIKNLVVVPLYLNGKGPFNFILDTGVGTFIITEPSLVDTLRLKNMSSIKVYGLGKGQEIEAYRTNKINLTMKSVEAQGVSTAILKRDVFNLSGYLGIKIYGLLGYNFFDSFDVKINYAEKRLTYAIPGNKIKKKGEKFDIFIENQRPYIFANVIPPSAPAATVKLIIDCGASHALSMDSLNEEAFPLPKEIIPANLGVGLGGEISGNMGRIQELTLGKFSFKNILSAFPKTDTSSALLSSVKRNGSLGAEILRRFTVTFDYTNAAVYLKPNQSFKLPFEHDMAGIEIYSDHEKNRNLFIGRIEAGSPADRAGLQVGAQILSINFKAVETLSLEEIETMLKSRDGSNVLIEVFYDKKYVLKILTLKKRI